MRGDGYRRLWAGTTVGFMTIALNARGRYRAS